jgi:hypothetical protein
MIEFYLHSPKRLHGFVLSPHYLISSFIKTLLYEVLPGTQNMEISLSTCDVVRLNTCFPIIMCPFRYTLQRCITTVNLRWVCDDLIILSLVMLSQKQNDKGNSKTYYYTRDMNSRSSEYDFYLKKMLTL